MGTALSKLLICVLLGSILSVLIAGACAIKATTAESAELQDRVDVTLEWGVQPAQHWPSAPLSHSVGTGPGFRGDVWVAQTPISQSPGRAFTMTVLSAGWPFAMLRGWRTYEFTTSPTNRASHHILEIPMSGQVGEIPTLPVWGGLIANVLFYALVCFGAWWALSRIRRTPVLDPVPSDTIT